MLLVNLVLTLLFNVISVGQSLSSLAEYGLEFEKETTAPSGDIVKLHWKCSDDSVRLAIEVPGAGSWAGLGVGSTMADADAVIGGGRIGSASVDGEGDANAIAAYALSGRGKAFITEDEALTQNGLSESQVVVKDGRTAVVFTRPCNNGVTSIPCSGGVAADFIFAYGSGNWLSYHYQTNGMLSINLGVSPAAGATGGAAVTTTPASNAGGGSSLAGFDFQSSLGPDVMLHYRKINDAEIKLALEVPVNGWGAVGVGSSMSDADVVIGGATKSGGQARDVRAYRLTAQGANGVVENQAMTAQLSKTQVKAHHTTSGVRTIIIFTQPFAPDGAKTIVYDADTPLIYAYGSGDTLSYHSSNKRAVLFNFASGGTTVDNSVRDNKVIHGALMVSSWGFLLPCGVLIATWGGPRFELAGNRAFLLHRAMQCLGLIVALCGVIFALIKLYGAEMPAHGVVGLAVMAVGIAQPLNAFIRPHADGKHRRAWELLHKNSGRIATLVGLVNCMIGALLAKDQHGDDSTAFDAIFGVAASFTGLFVLMWPMGKIFAFFALRNKECEEVSM